MAFFALFFLIIFSHCNAQEPTLTNLLHMQVHSKRHEPLTLILAALDDGHNNQIKTVAQLLKDTLMFTEQFTLKISYLKEVPTKTQMNNWWHQKIPFIIFLQQEGEDFTWRLYDTMQACMIKGKRLHQNFGRAQDTAYALADMIWPELTTNPGFFSTKIAYCKEVDKEKKRYKHIYIADFDGSNKHCVINTPTINLAPRWNKDVKNPMLFFSESTNCNVRLAVTNMQGCKKITSNFDGLNMLPHFSDDGKAAVYCASRGSGTCQIYYFKKGFLKRLTHNTGNNISPVLTNDQKVFFCSDYKTGLPQIFVYDLISQRQEQITNGGYCVSPSYCAKTGKLAYCKIVQGIMQIFTYDLASKKHKQCSFDKTSKEECSWSPCGNFLLCVATTRSSSRIAHFDINSKELRYLTGLQEKCSYPTWSIAYNNFPQLVNS
jgi:TolB protein